MTLYIVISLLVGLLLGQRFKVLILLPAIALILMLTIGTGIVRPDALWAIVVMAVGTVASLQIGYLVGIAIRRCPGQPSARHCVSGPIASATARTLTQPST